MRRCLFLLAFAACAGPRAPSPPPPDDDAFARMVWRGDRSAVTDALARGVDPAREPSRGKSAVFWAILAQDRPMIELLLARAPHLPDTLDIRVALRIAAARDDVWLIDALLARGVSIDGAVDERASPLMVAAENGSVAAMKHLLEAGASATFTDPAGDTPQAAALRSGCTPCVELLHVSGAALAGSSVPLPDSVATSPADAIARAIPLLQRANASWQADGECTSCHHLPMAVRAIGVAQRLGISVDAKLAREAVDTIRSDDTKFAELARKAFADPDQVVALSMEPAGDAAFGNAWFLAAEVDAGLPVGPDQQTLATGQARMQQPDGHWRVGPYRGVIESSDLEATALAIHAITGYGDAAARGVLPTAARWLEHARPSTIVDHAFLLRALRDLDRDIAPEIATLRTLQHADGSWSHTPGPGDAYSTGLVAVMLIEAGGVDPHDPAIVRAAAWLQRTQQPDGSWRVPSRAAQLLRYHDHGFPHGKLQFISFAGTAWAVTALAYAATRE